MKRIPLILYTGGTIGMIPSDRGQVADGSLPEALRLHPKIQKIDFDCLSITPLIDSSAMTIHTWQKIIDFVEREFDDDKHCSVVVLHGTDTLAYTAAFLSFKFANFPAPIFITGSMRSIHQHTEAQPSDGWGNIITALGASKTHSTGVWVVFADNIMHGARVSKVHSSDDNAFQTPNGDAEFLSNKELNAAAKLTPLTIDTITFTPTCNEALLKQRISLEIDVLILRVYGSGTVPDMPQFFAELKARNNQSLLTIAASQSIAGSLQVGHYAASNALIDSGCISASSMTYETTVAKIYFLYQLGIERNEIERLFCENLIGELS